MLIASTDAVIAALLGAWTKLERMQPVFPLADTTLDDSIDRLGIDLLVLDVDHPAAASDDFVRRQRERGLPVVMFSPGRIPRDVMTRATEAGCHWFPLPSPRARFVETVQQAAGEARPG